MYIAMYGCDRFGYHDVFGNQILHHECEHPEPDRAREKQSD